GGRTFGGGDVGEFKQPLVDGDVEESFRSFKTGSSSRCHGGLWWLIMDEGDNEVVVNIWREFIGIE
nr:hypothetical protein [Tanacetum cinerariifolium]